MSQMSLIRLSALTSGAYQVVLINILALFNLNNDVVGDIGELCEPIL